jgi:hypothetical protein
VLLLGLLSIWLWLAGSRKHSSPPHYSKCSARQLLLRLLRAFSALSLHSATAAGGLAGLCVAL